MKTDAVIAQDDESAIVQEHAEPTPQETAGGLIRAARERVGLHIAALSVALKVPVSKLEALESNRLDDLPGLAFTRSLASSVCRHLKIDPKPVLDLLPSHSSPQLVATTDGINTPFHKPGDRGTLTDTWTRLRTTVLTVALLLLAAVVIFAIPENWLGKLQFSGQTPASSKEQPAAKTNEVLEVVAPLAAASQAASAAVPSAEPAASSPQQPVPALLPSPAASQSAVGSGSAQIGFQAVGDTWVEVQDKDRQTVFKRLIKAGETQQIEARAPLAVSIGNAEKTRVLVRGKPFDLSPVTRENIARFAVN